MEICHTPLNRRLVDIFIDVHTEDPTGPIGPASAQHIAAIMLHVNRGSRFIETRLEDDDEAQLLRAFWLFVSPIDLNIDPTVRFEVEFIRQRSSALNLIPQPTAGTIAIGTSDQRA